MVHLGDLYGFTGWVILVVAWGWRPVWLFYVGCQDRWWSQWLLCVNGLCGWSECALQFRWLVLVKVIFLFSCSNFIVNTNSHHDTDKDLGHCIKHQHKTLYVLYLLKSLSINAFSNTFYFSAARRGHKVLVVHEWGDGAGGIHAAVAGWQLLQVTG